MLQQSKDKPMTLEEVKQRRANANSVQFTFRNSWGPGLQPQPFNMLDLDDVDWLINRIEKLEEELEDLKFELKESKEMPGEKE